MASASGTLTVGGDVVNLTPGGSDTTVTISFSGTFDRAHIAFEKSTDGTTFTQIMATSIGGRVAPAFDVIGTPDGTKFFSDITGLSLNKYRVKLQRQPDSGSVSVSMTTTTNVSRPSDTNLIPGNVKQVVYSLASAARTTTDNSGEINVDDYDQLIVGIDITATDGVKQVETAVVVEDVPGTLTQGNATVTVTAAGMTGSPQAVVVALATNDNEATVAGKFRTALAANANIASFFTVSGTGANVVLTAKVARANDATMNIAYADTTSSGLTDDATSNDTTAGVVAPFTFTLDYLGGDGIWYNVWSSSAIAQTLQTIGVSLDTAKLFSNIIRLVWTHASGSETFSASILGRKAK